MRDKSKERLNKNNIQRISIDAMEKPYEELHSEIIVETLLDNRRICSEEANNIMAYLAG